MGTQALHVHVASLLQRGKDRPVHPQAVRQVLHDKGLGSVRSANSPAEANGYSQTARSTFKTAAPRFKPVSGIFILPSGQLPIPVVYEQIAFFWNFRHRSRGVRTNSSNSCGTALPGCFLKFGKNCDGMEVCPAKGLSSVDQSGPIIRRKSLEMLPLPSARPFHYPTQPASLPPGPIVLNRVSAHVAISPTSRWRWCLLQPTRREPDDAGIGRPKRRRALELGP